MKNVSVHPVCSPRLTLASRSCEPKSSKYAPFSNGRGAKSVQAAEAADDPSAAKKPMIETLIRNPRFRRYFSKYFVSDP